MKYILTLDNKDKPALLTIGLFNNKDKYPWDLFFYNNDTLLNKRGAGHVVSVLMEIINAIPNQVIIDNMYYILYMYVYMYYRTNIVIYYASI